MIDPNTKDISTHYSNIEGEIRDSEINSFKSSYLEENYYSEYNYDKIEKEKYIFSGEIYESMDMNFWNQVNIGIKVEGIT